LAFYRVSRAPWDGTGAGIQPQKVAPPTTDVSDPLRPIVEVDKASYDFGTMDRNAPGRHEFVFKNAGKAPLTLSKGRTTCKCTMANLDKTTVAPGESTIVRLDWKAKGFSGVFQQSATVLTNDPKRSEVTLTVAGMVRVMVKALPEEAVFSNVLAGETGKATVQLLGFDDKPLEVLGHEWDRPETAKWFDTSLEPMPRSQVESEKGAKSGLLLHIQVKPGLPLGAFRQTIRLKTNSSDVPTLEIPITGSIFSDISVAGAGWDETRSLLTFGTVSGGEESTRSLLVFVRGPHQKEVKLTLASATPSLLKVEVGEAKVLSEGRMTQIPVTIRIPKGSPPANHLGGSEETRVGRILFETHHPEAKTLQILVRFAIEG
jgi:hypothetical protein